MRLPQLVRARRNGTIAFAAIAALAAVSGCDSERPNRPGVRGAREPGLTLSGVQPLVLMSSAQQLTGAQYRGDSAAFAVLVGRAKMRGQVGDSVSLKLDIDESLRAAVGKSVRLLVHTGLVTKSLSFDELQTGAVVYRFVRGDTATIEYRLTRQISRVVSGSIRLVQVTSALVEDSYTMWPSLSNETSAQSSAVQVSAGGRGGGSTTCSLSAQTGICGAVGWTIDPYAPGFAFLGFQSDPQTTGPSRPITIVFSSDVSSITTTVNDPTWPGNRITAYNGNTLVDSGSFAYSNQPGTNLPSTRVLSGQITKVVLTPADSDYVTYEAQITVDSKTRMNITCNPTPVIRGATVTCTATLSNNGAFSVIFAQTDAPDGSPLFVTGSAINGAKGWQVSGPALYTASLSVFAFKSPNPSESYAGTGHVEVTPRSFPAISFSGLPATAKDTTDPLLVDASLPVLGITWARFDRPKIDTLQLGTVPVITPSQGLFVGYAVLGAVTGLPLVAPRIRLNRTLFREGAFYRDQNGFDGVSTSDPFTGRSYCNNATDSTWVDRARDFVFRHEGVNGELDSHYAHWTQAFQTLNPQGTIEAMVFPKATSQGGIKNMIYSLFTTWLGRPSVEAPHNTIDARDRSHDVWTNMLGCALDRDLSVERGE